MIEPVALEEFLLTRHKSDIIEIISDEDLKKHFSVNINFVELFENDPELGNSILKDPEQALCDLENELFNAQEILIEELPEKYTLKTNTHARIYGLPICPELHRTKFPRNADTELFLQICGTVVRVTASKMLEFQRPYTCKKCNHIETVEADYDFKYVIAPPKKCSKCNGNTLVCSGELNADYCKDYQEIKIQEKASELGVGNMPSALWVTVEDDLVDSCKPGDDVIICGIVKVRHGPLIVGKRIDAEIVLQANHIQATNGYTPPKLITYEVKHKFILFWEKYKNNPIEGRDMILKSFCPKLYGMFLVKLAVAVVLAGGSRCKEGNEAGVQIRSEPHLLLVGDPGTGKSQLLRYAAKVVPRAVLTTGIGTTSAGLTAAAMMEDGHWQLEGGALVLADGGVCCIDEFNSMKPHDRTSIHEAMEQQTISIAKVGRVCKLQTRCTILAATNPKGGRLDPSQPLTLNLTLPSPLLSRFDIVMMLRDCFDENWDSLIADHILNGKGLEALAIDEVLWELETLQQYFILIKDINPVLTPVANKILGGYYQAQRRAESRNKARSTVRLLDSLIRLSQAHARLMYHSEVQVMDALYAVVLIETSMDGECSILLNKVNVTAPFVQNSNDNYKQVATTVLQKLGLVEILNEEIAKLNGSKDVVTELIGPSNAQDVNVKPNEGNNHVEKPNFKRTVFIKEVFQSSKKRKLHKSKDIKDNVELNDLELLNLIPRAADDFDLNVLEYMNCSSNSEAELNIEIDNIVNEETRTDNVTNTDRIFDFTNAKSVQNFTINTSAVEDTLLQQRNIESDFGAAGNSNSNANGTNNRTEDITVKEPTVIFKNENDLKEPVLNVSKTKKSNFSKFQFKSRNIPKESNVNATSETTQNLNKNNQDNCLIPKNKDNIVGIQPSFSKYTETNINSSINFGVEKLHTNSKISETSQSTFEDVNVDDSCFDL